jgi:hypothetical protein
MLTGSDAGHPGLRGGSFDDMMATARNWGSRMLYTPSYRIRDDDRPSDWGNPDYGSYTADTVAVAVSIARARGESLIRGTGKTNIFGSLTISRSYKRSK